MNPNIKNLYAIASRESRMILGLMSGTSVDGLDIVLSRMGKSGLETEFEILNFRTIPYHREYKEQVARVFAKKEVDLQTLCILNPWVAEYHARLIMQCLGDWNISPEEVDLIASHGQTIYHAPRSLHQNPNYPHATLQIGDGDHLARRTNIVTVSDFRQKHIAAGGEGAPLAVYGDYLVFCDPEENRIMLNIGGIANLTYLPGSMDPAQVFSTDVGPGNTIMDAYVRHHMSGKFFDENSTMALKGQVSQPLLQALKEETFFSSTFPKTAGPELFNLHYLDQAQAKSRTQVLSHEDILATLNRFSADMIVQALNQCLSHPPMNFTIYGSGGGVHNPLLMRNISQQLPGIGISSTQELGVDPDAKEALLFAILANECVAGAPINFGSGVPSVTMGKISFPT